MNEQSEAQMADLVYSITRERMQSLLYSVANVTVTVGSQKSSATPDHIAYLLSDLDKDAATNVSALARLSSERDAAVQTRDAAIQDLLREGMERDQARAELDSLRSRVAGLEGWITARVSWVDGHACATGDCPHDTSAECLAALISFLSELGGDARCVSMPTAALGKADK